MRTVVVTGGTAGIGKAIVHEFANKGWAVGFIARDQARVTATENELHQLGVRALGISADVADSDAVHAAAQRFERELGPITVWVNNAMVSIVSSTKLVTPEELRRVTEVTYFGQVYGTMAALKFMSPRNRGTIIQISSGLGFRAGPLQAPYCAAKFAVHGFTDALRSELIHEGLTGIQLTVAYLPAVNTPQPNWTRNHMGKHQIIPDPLYDPRLVANAIMYVAEHRRREVWIGNSIVGMAIGQAFVPEFMDKRLAGFWDSQLDKKRPPSNPTGNLFEPVERPAVIDGESKSRTKSSRYQFVTSTSRNMFVATFCTFAAFGGISAMVLILRRFGYLHWLHI